MTIKFHTDKTPIPILNCKTQDGKEFLAMVDTGSEITIFDHSFGSGEIMKTETDTDITLRSIHGEEQAATTFYELAMSVIDEEEYPVSLRGILSDLAPISKFLEESYGWDNKLSVVIGSDTLNALGWKVDFEERTVTI